MPVTSTGSVGGFSFRLALQHRRQAQEFLRSRGLEEPSRCKCLVDAVAMCLREGGSFDTKKLRHLGAFTANTWTHSISKLVDAGALVRLGSSVSLVVGLPLSPSWYYQERGDLYLPINPDSPTSRGKVAPKLALWCITAAENTDDKGPVLEFTTLNLRGEPDENGERLRVHEDEAYLRVAKLRQPGAKTGETEP